MILILIQNINKCKKNKGAICAFILTFQTYVIIAYLFTLRRFQRLYAHKTR
jgi:hypothetical protein